MANRVRNDEALSRVRKRENILKLSNRKKVHWYDIGYVEMTVSHWQFIRRYGRSSLQRIMKSKVDDKVAVKTDVQAVNL